MKKKSTFFKFGPFHEAILASDEFGMGLYYTYCLDSTMKRVTELEREYAEALITRDSEMIAEKQGELEFYENILLLATDFSPSTSALTGAFGD